MLKSYVNVNLNLEKNKPSLELILNALNKSINDINKIYVGDTHGCRCGCHGKYHDYNTRGAKMALTKIIKIMNEDKVIKWKDINYTDADCYLDIPYITDNGAERSVCLCFKKDAPKYSDNIANERFREWTAVEAC